MNAQPFYHRESGIALSNAQYGIQVLRQNPREYLFYLRGTLAALRCIPDYVLEEANQKFSFFIELDEPLGSQKFRKRAKEMNDAEAVRFIDEFEKTKDELMADPVMADTLGPMGERNILMHRKASRLMSVSHIRLNEQEKYELVGEPTSHFVTKNGKGAGVLPSERDVPETLSYCLDKLGAFRGHLIYELG